MIAVIPVSDTTDKWFYSAHSYLQVIQFKQKRC